MLPILLLLTLAAAPFPLGAATTPEQRALAGLKSAKVIVDVRVPDQEKMVFNLQLIHETLQGIRQQKVRPEMVVTFRGPGVRLMTQTGADEEVRELLAGLASQGVRLEACAVAMRIFRVAPGPLVPGVVLVDNVLTSLIGYQNKGYAVISLN
jgi:intracellular sulfur oxidation DsrE/DsrF family protein